LTLASSTVSGRPAKLEVLTKSAIKTTNAKEMGDKDFENTGRKN